MPDTASITIPIIEGTITVVFYPKRITIPFIAKQIVGLKLHASSMHNRMLDKALAHLIKSWDVYEDDEVTMYPLEPKRLAELPISFKLSVLEAIVDTKRSGYASSI